MVKVPADWDECSLSDLFGVLAGGDLKKSLFSPYRTQAYTYKIFSNAIENYGLYQDDGVPKGRAKGTAEGIAREQQGEHEEEGKEMVEFVRLSEVRTIEIFANEEDLE